MERGQIQICEPSEGDLPPAAEVVRDALLATYPGVTPEVTAEALAHHVSGDWLEHKVAALRHEAMSEASVMRVARVAERVVGFCIADKRGQNGQLAVHPEYQRSTVAVRLMLAVGQRIDPGRDFSLWVVPGVPAERLYESLGFAPTNRDITDEFPVLRGGQVLPQRELIIAADHARRGLERMARVLAKRGRSSAATFTPSVTQKSR